MKKSNLFQSLKIIAIVALIAPAIQAQTYSTSFDAPDFTAGNLDTQDGWVAQGQWQADGAGNITSTVGAFIRGHNTNVLGSTTIGESFAINSTLTLGAFSTPSDDIAAFEEGIYQVGLSHQQNVPDFGFGIAAGLFFNVGTGDLELRANQGVNETGTSVATIGSADGLGGTTYNLDTLFTKTADDTWQVDATLTDANNAANVFTLNYTANGQNADLNTDSDGGGIIGGIQALPSGGGSGGVVTAPFGPTTVSDFSITVTAVPEPSSLLLLCTAGIGLLVSRRRF